MPEVSRLTSWRLQHSPAWILIALFSFVCLIIAIPILGGQNFYSDDLSGHIALVLRMAGASNDPWFYDRAWFSGYAAFEFYGFIPHWITAQLLGVFGHDWAGATRAVHAVTAASIVLLPISAWWFLRSWFPLSSLSGWWTAGGLCIVFALFLTLYEPGTFAGLRYFITSGVFAQAPGWVLMFAYLALLGRDWQHQRAFGWLSVLGFNALIATHPLTAVAALMAGLSWPLAHGDWRSALAQVIAMIASSAWFWLPIVAWTSAYGAGNPYSSDLTVVSVLFDGWLDFLNGMAVSGWTLLAEMALGAVVAYALYIALVDRTSQAMVVVILLLTSLLVTGSALSEASAIGLHYDRLVVTLSLVAALAAVAVVAARAPDLPEFAVIIGSGVLLLFATILLAGLIDSQPWLSDRSPHGYDEEETALQALSALPSGSRVFMEYAKSRSDSDVEPGKYLESRLWETAGIEISNGMLVQSSQTYQLYTTATSQLRAHSFGVPPFAVNYVTVDGAGVIDILRRNSVSHIVSANENFRENLGEIDGVTRVGGIGRYTLHEVTDPDPRLNAVTVPLVGYVDLKGNLPFRFMDTFVEFREALSGDVRLVKLDPADVHTAPVDGLIVNTDDSEREKAWRWFARNDGTRVPALAISFQPQRISRLEERTSHHDKRAYNQVAAYLYGSPFERLLHGFSRRPREASPPSASLADHEWRENGQAVRFSGLTPGQWYEFAYSAFPAWHADGVTLRRGSAGHVFFRSAEESFTAHYNRWSTKPVLIGWLMTLLACLGLAMARMHWPNRDDRSRKHAAGAGERAAFGERRNG